MCPSEAKSLSECIFRSYGHSYDVDWVYHPEQIAEKLQNKLYYSVVGIADGDIVGHVGFALESKEDSVGEAGQAVVDTRFRGHHLFTSMKKYLAHWCAEQSYYGIFSEATAAHPYSQKANINLQATETGMLLGYIPSSVEYAKIDKSSGSHRTSIALFYLRTNSGHQRPVYTPKRHWDVVNRIIKHSGLSGKLTEAEERKAPLTSSAELRVLLREDHNQALITVDTYGENLISVVKTLLDTFCNIGANCIYLDLPLNDPETGRIEGQFEQMGFFFGGIFPNKRVDGDVLRLQLLNNVEINAGDVSTASEFGKGLLDYIISEKDEHHRG